ncbi:MAG: beta-glucosidase BglX [Clostridia bacterium]|nr:beta-glucosidase BglX [Clostridia bacterium]
MDIKKLLSQMSLTEKLGELSQYNMGVLSTTETGDLTGPANDLKLTKEELAVVGSVLGYSSAEGTKKMQDEHIKNHPHGIPLLFMQDIIHGYRTNYPIPLGMGATFDPNLMEECARMSAKEAAVNGLHVTFNPMVDLARDARWGRCMETTGEDPYLNSLMSAAQVRGYQSDMNKEYSIAACVKHYAAYGAAEAGRDYNTVDVSERSLRDYYLPAYKAAVDAGVEMVMSSFNLVNGVPSTGNKWLLDDVLRKEWGFDKILISDYNAVYEMYDHGYAKDAKDCAEKAINAGMDIEMMTTCYLKEIPALIEEGKVSMETVDKAVLRVLDLKNRLGLFENPYYYADKEKADKIVFCDEHRALARLAGEKSCVLLKNDNNVLPLNEHSKTVALIGPFIEEPMIGGWPGAGSRNEVVTPLTGVKNLLKDAKILTAKGCNGTLKEQPDYKMIKQAVKCAKKAESVVLVLGEHDLMAGEGKSKTDINITPAQVELCKAVCKANKNTAVFIYTGRPLVLSEINDIAPAIAIIWQPGTENGNVLANMAFGKANFSGKLPMTFPRAVGQVPIYYNFYTTGRPNHEHDLPIAYRSAYQDERNSPLYPFGYGLSYAKFEISDPVLSSNPLKRGETLTASVVVKNVSDVDGEETVQLYIKDCYASLARPIKELKGFKKVNLKAGEETTICFEISEKQLEFFTANNVFEAENGDFKVFISNNSNVKTFATFKLI